MMLFMYQSVAVFAHVWNFTLIRRVVRLSGDQLSQGIKRAGNLIRFKVQSIRICSTNRHHLRSLLGFTSRFSYPRTKSLLGKITPEILSCGRAFSPKCSREHMLPVTHSYSPSRGLKGKLAKVSISKHKQSKWSRLCVGAIDLQKDKMLKVPSSYYD